MNISEKYMNRCLELARLGVGDGAPNPIVGCVIIYQDKIIGEGFHQQFGGPHAEVNAINSVKNKELLKKSTLYVSLEPCAHFGKTPPCSDLIIEYQIPRVVIGSVDPFAKVAGKGIAKMKKAGIRIELGILEKECLELNRRFFIFHEKKRPFVVLKWAQSMDGFLDTNRTESAFGQPTWISNDLSRRCVHRQRTEEAAILVGTNTAIKDNPSLTVREWSGKQPVRLVLDRQERLPESLNLKDGSVRTVIFTVQENRNMDKLEFVKLNFLKPIPPQILNWLYQHELQSVIVEGGKQLLQDFIDHELWDEAFIYIGQVKLGNGIAAPELRKRPLSFDLLDEDLLQVFVNQ